MSRRMSFRALFVLALVVGVIVPASALAAKPLIFHAHILDELSDVDVCGINVDVVVEGVFTDKVFLDAEGNFVRFSSTYSVKQTFTADNGKSVLVQGTGQITSGTPIVDEAAGTITFVETFKGLPEKIKTPKGPVLLRDAGVISFVDTFDLETGEFISSEIVVKGPHPEADSDFTLFCEVISEALA